ncbi:MAG: DNA-binding protein [Spirochaetota bacterium]
MSRVIRIFLDANILFSYAKTDGAIRRLLNLILEAGHNCLIHDFVYEEARRNLALKKPEGLPVLEELCSRLTMTGSCTVAPVERNIPLPEKDLPVLFSAIRHHCQALVTGDRTHFGHLYGKTIRGMTIHSARSLAELLIQ